MVRFHSMCDDKIILLKKVFFLFLCGNVKFFLQKSRRALSNWKIGLNEKNGQVFSAKFETFFKFFEKTSKLQNTIRFVIIRPIK